jgi:hypothetical protein
VAELFAKGYNGQVRLEGDWLTIERKGLGRIGHSKGDRRIPLASITAVQLRPAGRLANGFIRFSVPGSPEARGGLQNATKDENAVVFTRGHAAEFESLREAVEEYIASHHAGMRGGSTGSDVPDQIRKLGELRDQGLLTDEEFEAKKADLLDRL